MSQQITDEEIRKIITEITLDFVAENKAEILKRTSEKLKEMKKVQIEEK